MRSQIQPKPALRADAVELAAHTADLYGTDATIAARSALQLARQTGDQDHIELWSKALEILLRDAFLTIG